MAASLHVLELTFLPPQTTPKRCLPITRRNSLSKFSLSRSSWYNIALRTRIRAAREEGGVVVEDKKSELIKGLNGSVLNGNGAAAASTSESDFGYYENGSVSEVESVKGESNGGLLKYVNGNGVASEVVEEVQVSGSKEEGRKRRIEEIGKEEAWFRQSGGQEVEVWFCDVK